METRTRTASHHSPPSVLSSPPVLLVPGWGGGLGKQSDRVGAWAREKESCTSPCSASSYRDYSTLINCPWSTYFPLLAAKQKQFLKSVHCLNQNCTMEKAHLHNLSLSLLCISWSLSLLTSVCWPLSTSGSLQLLFSSSGPLFPAASKCCLTLLFQTMALELALTT